MKGYKKQLTFYEWECRTKYLLKMWDIPSRKEIGFSVNDKKWTFKNTEILKNLKKIAQLDGYILDNMKEILWKFEQFTLPEISELVDSNFGSLGFIVGDDGEYINNGCETAIYEPEVLFFDFFDAFWGEIEN